MRTFASARHSLVRASFATSLQLRVPSVALSSSGASVDDSGESETALVEQKWEPQRVVVAVGGNALQRRGERLTIENQLKAAADAAPAIKALSEKHQAADSYGVGRWWLLSLLSETDARSDRDTPRRAGARALNRGDPQVVLTHGNGPQVGELALERSAATFDVLGAESQGQIGFVFAQAMANVGLKACSILTQVRIERTDPAFQSPTKFVGPVYGAKEAEALAKGLGWVIKPDGEYYRRVVPSPMPVEIFQVDAVRALLDAPIGQPPMSILPIVCGGGGVPVGFDDVPLNGLVGIEAVIDKDNCGALLARSLSAHGFVVLTDGGGIWENFGKPGAREMAAATPAYLREMKAGAKFPGSMGPKIQAAMAFVDGSDRPNAWAAIGDLRDAQAIIDGSAGTVIRHDVPGEGVIWRERGEEAEPEGAPAARANIHKYG